MRSARGLISHAAANEDSGIYNGAYGDQNGFELGCARFWENEWHTIYRAVNDEDKEKIADFMEKAVSNGNIGYDTNKTKRDTLFTNLVANGFKPEEITEPSLCDCSSLVYAAMYNVTGVACAPKESSNELISPRIRNFEEYITTCSGFFDTLTFPDYITDTSLLIRGDILVALKDNGDGTWTGHTGVFV